MIIKHRKTPAFFPQYESLLRRLQTNHPMYQRIEEQFAQYKAGFAGEKSVDYPLSFLSASTYHIFHQVRLYSQDHFFEVDTLLLCQNFALILEIKNYKGALRFDVDRAVLHKTTPEKEEVFDCPILQAERQAIRFKLWLAEQSVTNLPVYHHVLLAHKESTVLNEESLPHVSRIEHVTRVVDQIHVRTPNEAITAAVMKRIGRSILQRSVPKQEYLLQKFMIRADELIHGVHCTSCHSFAVERVARNWICRNCNFKAPNMHLATIADFRNLFGMHFATRDLMQWMGIESSQLARRLVERLASKSSGSTHRARYTFKT